MTRQSKAASNWEQDTFDPGPKFETEDTIHASLGDDLQKMRHDEEFKMASHNTWREDEDKREAKELKVKCLEMSLRTFPNDAPTSDLIRRGAAFYNYVIRNSIHD